MHRVYMWGAEGQREGPKSNYILDVNSNWIIREVKHDVNGRRQTAKTTSDFEFFSFSP